MGNVNIAQKTVHIYSPNIQLGEISDFDNLFFHYSWKLARNRLLEIGVYNGKILNYYWTKLQEV